MVYKQTEQIRKGLTYATTFAIFCISMCGLFCSCKSNDGTAISYTAIEHSAEVKRIEDAITHYGNTVDIFVADLAERTKTTRGTLEDLSILLEEYFTRVGNLLQQYKHLQRFIEQRAYLKQSFDQNIDRLAPIDNNPDSS